MDTAADYRLMLNRVLRWATARYDIFAIIMVGSQARGDHPADACSDLDLMAFTADRAVYEAD